MGMLSFSPAAILVANIALNEELRNAQARLAEFIGKGAQAETHTNDLAHIELETLRFERNAIRSRILDLQAFLAAIEARVLKQNVLQFIHKHYPNVYQEISNGAAPLPAWPPAASDTIDLLAQQLDHARHKVHSSHLDQKSMMTQIQERMANSSASEDWLNRVNYALGKSRSYFLRQCQLIRSLRKQICDQIEDSEVSLLYAHALTLKGKAFVESIQEAAMAELKKAA